MLCLRLQLVLMLVEFTLAFYFRGNRGLFDAFLGFPRFCFCRCGIVQNQILENVRVRRMLGGEATVPHQYPWLVSINIAGDTFGGSLISDRHVITAASLLHGITPADVSVTLGANDLCISSTYPALHVRAMDIIIHPGYSPTNMNNDIALIKLRHSVPFSDYISPICMPFYENQHDGEVARIAGWRRDDENTTCAPRVSTLPILPSRLCFKYSIDVNLVTPDKGCLGPLGGKSVICKADVGSPVMWRWSESTAFRLIGVMSSATSCDQHVTPLYTRVVDHASWINQYIRADCQCF